MKTDYARKKLQSLLAELDSYTSEEFERQTLRIIEGTTGKEMPDLEWDYPVDIFRRILSENSPYAFYLLQWVPYQQIKDQITAQLWRLKMQHDVKTFDGREAFGIWPNGSSCGPFKDDEVEFIRISANQFGHKYIDPRNVEAAKHQGGAE